MYRIMARCIFPRIGNRSAVITLFLVFLSFFTFAVPGDTITLKSIPDVPAPVYKDKKMWYTVNLIFDRCSKDYWIYYDDSLKQLVIEFMGTHVVSDDVMVNGTPVITNPTVSNYETGLAFNGKKAQIRFDMKDPWHYDEDWVIDGKVLQFKLWMPLNTQKALNRKKSWPYIIGGAVSIVVLIISSVIYIAMQDAQSVQK